MKASELSTIPQNVGLVNPEDKLTARVTDSGREVVTIEKIMEKIKSLLFAIRLLILLLWLNRKKEDND